MIESWELRVTPREYQRTVAESACRQNTLVVLPTGLGKTIIGMMVADSRLRESAASRPELPIGDGLPSSPIDPSLPPAGDGNGIGEFASSIRFARVLMTAPTKPLVIQHLTSFRGAFTGFPDSSFVLLTGDDPPDERERIWRGMAVASREAGEEKHEENGDAIHSLLQLHHHAATFVFATPETIVNDIQAGRTDLNDFVLLILDEAHRCVGDYAYTEIVRAYTKQASDPRILGLTASPGSTIEKLEEVMENLHAVKVEARSEEDRDVSPYVEDTRVKTVWVKLPDEFKPLVDGLTSLYNEKISKLRRFGFFKGERLVSKKTLLEARQVIAMRLRGQQGGKEEGGWFSGSRGYLFAAMTVQSQAVIILHAIELIETQGVATLCVYLEKLRYGPGRGRSAKALLKDERWMKVEERASKLLSAEKKNKEGLLRDHPKIGMLLSLVREQFARKPSSKVIVFTQYRDTIGIIISALASDEVKAAVKAQKFVGQSTKSQEDTGMNQKKQQEVLERFGRGVEFNILVSSSIGEEGLHVPDVDLVIFYEAVPSAIRSIQRKGRTGRTMPGNVAILVAQGTVDEAYYRTTSYKEKMMKKLVGDSSSSSNREESARKKKEQEVIIDLDELAKEKSAPTLMDFMEEE